MKIIDTIIFDLGGVLIDWNPEYVFLDAFNGDKKQMQWFLDNVCTINSIHFKNPAQLLSELKTYNIIL